jgi:hypothetical protein
LILTVTDDMPITERAVEAALRLGADALKVILYPFTNNRQNQADQLTTRLNRHRLWRNHLCHRGCIRVDFIDCRIPDGKAQCNQ